MSETIQSTAGTAARSTSPRRPTPDATRPNRNLVISFGAMAVVFFLGTVVMTLVASSLASELSDERDGRSDVEATSSRFAAEFLGYEGTKLDDAKRAAGALSTAKLREQLETAIDRVAPALKGTKARARATVTGVYVGEVDGDRAESVVTVDVVVSSTEVDEATQQQVLALGLVKHDGEWRIDEVTNLRATSASGAPTTP
jgi:hypothetical protein